MSKSGDSDTLFPWRYHLIRSMSIAAMLLQYEVVCSIAIPLMVD